jgi:SAM-dependent methyltransferase
MDQRKIKKFWDDRAKTYNSVSFESIANLEEDPENLQLKIDLETEKVFRWLEGFKGHKILDLGAGVGQWAFRFIDGGAKSVTAVEYSAQLADIGTAEAEKRGVKNLDFLVSPAEDFIAVEKFDIVFISGLFLYLNDEQSEELMVNIQHALGPDTIICLRDGTGREQRHEIDDKKSAHLKSNYSATYRTRYQYIDLFQKNGLTLIKDEDMFDADCLLNKYPETRLRIYLFKVG